MLCWPRAQKSLFFSTLMGFAIPERHPVLSWDTPLIYQNKEGKATPVSTCSFCTESTGLYRVIELPILKLPLPSRPRRNVFSAEWPGTLSTVSQEIALLPVRPSKYVILVRSGRAGWGAGGPRSGISLLSRLPGGRGCFVHPNWDTTHYPRSVDFSSGPGTIGEEAKSPSSRGPE